MDSARLLNQIRDSELLAKAFRYVLRDRVKGQFFFDPFETVYAVENESQIIREIQVALNNIEGYEPSQAYAYFTHKTSLCYRRMIQLPIKDQVIRYAMATVFGDMIDPGLVKTCFANRRAQGAMLDVALLEDFAKVSWPNWCKWQADQKEKYNCMLKTDIAAFYDSISHIHLSGAVAQALGVSPSSPLMSLFRKCLKAPVESYTFQSNPRFRLQILEQGLVIGPSSDSIFANIYLKEIDEALIQLPGIEFGRYNDDMRIFGNDRSSLLNAMKVLQEMLLSKGLNLNSAKTLLAEGIVEMDQIISRDLPSLFGEEPDEPSMEIKKEGAEWEINQPFQDAIIEFTSIEEIRDDKSAKAFLSFLQDRIQNGVCDPWQIKGLEKVLLNFPGAGKHASWVLVLASTSPDIEPSSRKSGCELLAKIMANHAVSPYTHYRIIYHLIRPNHHPYYGMDPEKGIAKSFEENPPENKLIRLLERIKHRQFLKGHRAPAKTLIPDEIFSQISEGLPDLLGKKSNELDLIIIFFMIISGKEKSEVLDLLTENVTPPLSSPILEAVRIIQDMDSDRMEELWSELFLLIKGSNFDRPEFPIDPTEGSRILSAHDSSLR